jgi:hypothetical protein
VHVYRNGIRIAVSTCSTGKAGHSTPTGVFTILQKDKNHHSSTYNNAPMPNMNRLTWSGVALHAGNLPGYPASHGCVRLPTEFSERLFSVTHIGTPVIIAGAHADPREVVHPGMVLAEYAKHEFDDAVSKLKDKGAVDQVEHALALLVSGVEKRAVLLLNGDIVLEGDVRIEDPDRPLGSHVFILQAAHGGSSGLAWHAIGHHADNGSTISEPEEKLIYRVRADDGMVKAVQQRMHAGMVMVLTDLPLHPDTRTGNDFVIVTQADPA